MAAPYPGYVMPQPPPVKSRKGTIITLSILLGVSVLMSVIWFMAFLGNTYTLGQCQDASYYWEKAAHSDTDSDWDDNVYWAQQADAECF